MHDSEPDASLGRNDRRQCLVELLSPYSEITAAPDDVNDASMDDNSIDDSSIEETNQDAPGCPKCGQTDTETGSISVAGTGLSKMFDVQNNHFQVISCTNCGYSEFYRDDASGNLLDLFLS